MDSNEIHKPPERRQQETHSLLEKYPVQETSPLMHLEQAKSQAEEVVRLLFKGSFDFTLQDRDSVQEDFSEQASGQRTSIGLYSLQEDYRQETHPLQEKYPIQETSSETRELPQENQAQEMFQQVGEWVQVKPFQETNYRTSDGTIIPIENCLGDTNLLHDKYPTQESSHVIHLGQQRNQSEEVLQHLFHVTHHILPDGGYMPDPDACSADFYDSVLF